MVEGGPSAGAVGAKAVRWALRRLSQLIDNSPYPRPRGVTVA